MRAWMMLPCLLLASVSVASIASVSSAWAQASPPPPPSAATATTMRGTPEPTAWACTKKTLVDDAPCTVEGKTAAQPASKDASKEQQRQAKLLGDEVCRALARTGEADEDAGLLAVCNTRMTVATKKCGGDGSRRLLDDDGRFNPGHTKCYGAMAGVVRDMIALSETSSTCCACIEDQCGGAGNDGAAKCVEKIGAGQKPAASAQCLTTTCSSECAVLQLVSPTPSPTTAPPTKTRKP